MKKVAFIIRLFQDNSFYGGGEKVFYRLIKEFINDNYIIDIYCHQSNVQEFSGINKIVQVEKPYNKYDPECLEAFYDEVKKLIKYENYDAVISENINPPVDTTFLHGHSALHRKNKVRGIFESIAYNFRPSKQNLIKYEKKWLKGNYRKLFVPSIALKNDIVENYQVPADKISVIYLGVDLPENELIKEKNEVFTFGLSAPGFVRKGDYVFLNAIRILKNKGYKFKAKIIYPKYQKNLYVKALVKLWKIEDLIEFIPFQSNMQEFFKLIDCLVMPSYEESFGLVALEAMANKLPCIVSSVSGASEVIQDGENGFMFDTTKKPYKNLALKMSQVVEEKENLQKITQNGFKTAQTYSWKRTYKDFVENLFDFTIDTNL